MGGTSSQFYHYRNAFAEVSTKCNWKVGLIVDVMGPYRARFVVGDISSAAGAEVGSLRVYGGSKFTYYYRNPHGDVYAASMWRVDPNGSCVRDERCGHNIPEGNTTSKAGAGEDDPIVLEDIAVDFTRGMQGGPRESPVEYDEDNIAEE